MRSFIDRDFSVSLQSLVGRPWGGFPQYSSIISGDIKSSSELPPGIFKSYAKYYTNYIRDNSYSYPYVTPWLVTIENGQVSADFSTSSIPYASCGDESVTEYIDTSASESHLGLYGIPACINMTYPYGFDSALYMETPPHVYVTASFNLLAVSYTHLTLPTKRIV